MTLEAKHIYFMSAVEFRSLRTIYFKSDIFNRGILI